MEAEHPDTQAARGGVDRDALLRIGRELLVALGEDPTRAGILDTPRRWADWWVEFIDYDAGNTDTTFEAVTVNQMVVVSGMRVWSLCEHHLLPFSADVSVGYITGDRVVGLSKFARIAHDKAHTLQIQERLAHQIADEIARLSQSESVAVLVQGEHLCMTMRGIQTPATMTSSVMRGQFLRDENVRQEFLQLTANCNTRMRHG